MLLWEVPGACFSKVADMVPSPTLPQVADQGHSASAVNKHAAAWCELSLRPSPPPTIPCIAAEPPFSPLPVGTCDPHTLRGLTGQRGWSQPPAPLPPSHTQTHVQPRGRKEGTRGQQRDQIRNSFLEAGLLTKPPFSLNGSLAVDTVSRLVVLLRPVWADVSLWPPGSHLI